LKGTDTTSITLNWALLFAVKYPEMQRRIQEELDEACGRSRHPLWCDRQRTPFSEAFLHEAQRLGDVVPNGVVRATNASVQLSGFAIPPRATVMPLLTTVMKDPYLFADPLNFKPERFLDDEGVFTSGPHVLAFGVGKRRCLGEMLARIELYLFFTGLLHHFTVEPMPGEDLLESTLPGSVAQPPKFLVKFTARA